MKKLALFSSIVAVLLLSLCAPQPPLAVAQTAPVTLAFNLTTAGQRLPTINLVGSMSSCSIVVTSAGTFELDPQAASDGIINGVGNPTPSWVTATTVGGGAITEAGTYTGQIATIALTSFGGILKTTDGTPVTGSMACSGAIATASGGATGSPGPPGPATVVTSSPGVTVVEVTTGPAPVYQVGVHLGNCLGIVTSAVAYTCASPTAGPALPLSVANGGTATSAPSPQVTSTACAATPAITGTWPSQTLSVPAGCGGGVSSINSETGAVTLTSTGSTVTITPSGQTINLEAPGSAVSVIASPPITIATPSPGVFVVGCGATSRTCVSVPSSACGAACTAVLLQAPTDTPSPQPGFASLQYGIYLYPPSPGPSAMPAAVRVWNGGRQCEDGDLSDWGTTSAKVYGVVGQIFAAGCDVDASPWITFGGHGDAGFTGHVWAVGFNADAGDGITFHAASTTVKACDFFGDPTFNGDVRMASEGGTCTIGLPDLASPFSALALDTNSNIRAASTLSQADGEATCTVSSSTSCSATATVRSGAKCQATMSTADSGLSGPYYAPTVATVTTTLTITMTVVAPGSGSLAAFYWCP